jgi:hypothetical protein
MLRKNKRFGDWLCLHLTLMMETEPVSETLGFELNIDTAYRPRGFYNIHAPWKFQILHSK